MRGKDDDAYEVILEEISDKKADEIKEYIIENDLKGVHFEKNGKRIYPLNRSASHVVGFVGFNDADQYRGQYGLEKYFENKLLTPAKESIRIRSALDVLHGGPVVSSGDPIDGGDLHTTIEPVVQKNLEKILKKIHSSEKSQLTAGVVIDPKTGYIYALSSYPDFNPNDRDENTKYYTNPIVQNIYEVGSIFKPLTVAIGLDSGAIKPSDTYHDRGFILSSGKRIENYDGKGRGPNITIEEILKQSLNTGVGHIVRETTLDIFHSYIGSLLLGDVTRIDLPGEVSGNIANLNSGREIEHITASYGHGIAVTPIGIARALSSLANGGVLVQPKLAIRDSDSATDGKNLLRVFSEKTTKQVTSMLQNVFDEALLGGILKDPNYTFAAKTGTALLFNPEEGGYHKDKSLHSFFGYFPANNPRFLVLLFTVDPKKSRFASGSLSRPFKNLADFMISYYALPPDRE